MVKLIGPHEKELHVPEAKCTIDQVFRQAGNQKESINDKSSRMRLKNQDFKNDSNKLKGS